MALLRLALSRESESRTVDEAGQRGAPATTSGFASLARMLYAPQTSGTCWWSCTAPVDPREHKLKRSDLVRQFGPGPYKELTSVREGRNRNVQGPTAS